VKLFNTAEQFVSRLRGRGAHDPLRRHEAPGKDVIAEEAERCGMFHVNERWLGGLLTNFATIQRSLGRSAISRRCRPTAASTRSRRRRLRATRKSAKKLAKNLDGIRGMTRLPDAVFIVDTKKEQIAVDEARKLKIPVIGIVDTNCDPDQVDFVIPGNDDALRRFACLRRASPTPWSPVAT